MTPNETTANGTTDRNAVFLRCTSSRTGKTGVTAGVPGNSAILRTSQPNLTTI